MAESLTQTGFKHKVTGTSTYSRWLPVPPRCFDESKPEMVDMPDADPELLRGEMHNLRKINRRFGGYSAVQKAVLPMVISAKPGHTIELLDLATGSGDQAVAIVRECREIRRRIRVTAVDRNETVLEEARSHAAGIDVIRFEKGDITSLPYSDQSFDIVLCSLALHHFSRRDAVQLLREMNRISRIGLVISDLTRSYAALACAWLYTRVTTNNIMTRTDAIASIRAAFREDELSGMAEEAGIGSLTFSREPFFRLNAVKLKS